MQVRIQCDLDYPHNWSAWLDLSILMEIVRVVLSRESAL